LEIDIVKKMADKHHAPETAESLLAQLDEKVIAELKAGNVYEALQYVQSFIARKKKILGTKGTATAVFQGARVLIKEAVAAAANTPFPGALSADILTLSSTAGGLLRWFIEDGAGPENQFHMQADQLNSTNYCDIQHLYDFLQGVDVRVSGPVVDAIYNPLHVLIAKSKIKKHSHLAQRINRLEILFARVLQYSKRWLSAFKSFVRLQDADKTAEVLNQWSAEGYATEKPLFFARGLFHVLSEAKMAFAKELLHASLQYVDDNIAPGRTPGGPMSASLAVWHVAVILTDLSNFPPMPRVDKTKLFGMLHRRYGALLVQIDLKMLELFLKVGEACFNYVLENPADNTPSPMSMLQSLLTGGASNQPPKAPNGAGGNRRPAPGMDISQLMRMMNMQQGQGAPAPKK
jgi:hypothetical protein